MLPRPFFKFFRLHRPQGLSHFLCSLMQNSLCPLGLPTPNLDLVLNCQSIHLTLQKLKHMGPFCYKGLTVGLGKTIGQNNTHEEVKKFKKSYKLLTVTVPTSQFLVLVIRGALREQLQSNSFQSLFLNNVTLFFKRSSN